MAAGVNEYAKEHGKTNGDIVTLDDIKPYVSLDADGKIRSCPDGGEYIVSAVGVAPRCSFGTNAVRKIRWGFRYWDWTQCPESAR